MLQTSFNIFMDNYKSMLKKLTSPIVSACFLVATAYGAFAANGKYLLVQNGKAQSAIVASSPEHIDITCHTLNLAPLFICDP